MKTIEVFKRTQENFHPSYPGGLVRINFCDFSDVSAYDYDSKFLVNVWGADDCGFEKWFNAQDESSAWNCFLSLISEKYITRQQIKALGLVSA